MARDAAGTGSWRIDARTAGQQAARIIVRVDALMRDPRFWAVQALVAVATLTHWTLDALEQTSAQPADLSVVIMYAVYFVPVIYASLTFGREGAIPTAIWLAVLALPTIIFVHTGVDRVAEMAQHATIIALTVLVADRVDREVAARRQAEAEGQARLVSEAKYRRLFEKAGEPILVVDHAGLVEEANAAAGELFEQTPVALRGAALRDLIGAESAGRLCEGGGNDGADFRLSPRPGLDLWVEPICSPLQMGGQPALQVLLRNVTERRARQRGLEDYARQIVQAQEDERKRIARELHDGSLQSIVMLCRQLDTLEMRAGELPGSVEERLEEARELAESVAAELRRFSRDLRPSILDDLGLVPACRWLVGELGRRAHLRAQVRVEGDERRLPAEVELGLFRIMQEALRNVERHSAATSASLTLSFREMGVRVVVEDDGVGFPSDALLAPGVSGQLGLLGMRERARLLGATVRVASTPGSGTRVDVAVPSRSA
ncbi:MAG TPA: histidine kinase [Thermomicrobiaceae bacterium]|nr:histidine kinase [Thermomicrobiaceae bacterium]